MLYLYRVQSMARPSTIAVGLRLPEDLLERVNARAEEMGMNRSALIVLALNNLLEGTQTAPRPAPAIPSTSAVDQPARDALTALLGRVEAIEQELRAMDDTPNQATEELMDFADRFKQ